MFNQKVDVLTNAANERLMHAGGIAGQFVKRAGWAFQEWCIDKILDDGTKTLNVGDSVFCPPFNLEGQCKQIANIVGPFYEDDKDEECRNILRKAIYDLLFLSECKFHKSIAIPAVSAGIFRFPKRACAESIYEGVIAFQRHQDKIYKNGTVG